MNLLRLATRHRVTLIALLGLLTPIVAPSVLAETLSSASYQLLAGHPVSAGHGALAFPGGSALGSTGYSIGQLSDEILSKTAILYIWVTPEESRRKNDARTDPNDPGSILHHGVPMEVMLGEYGCDDMDWLEANSGKPGMVKIDANGKSYHLPIARFDNRVDKTSFIRDDKAAWKPGDVKAVHEGLRGALDKLAAVPLASKS